MPQPKTKKARKQKLWQPKPKPSYEKCWFQRIPAGSAKAIAFEACGFVRHEVVAPRTLESAESTNPTGPTSIEYTDPHAISTRNDVYDPLKNPYGRRRVKDVLKKSTRRKVGVGFSALLWLIILAKEEQTKREETGTKL